MTRILSTITRVFALPTHAESDVHFHGGPQGAYVCGNASCVSPGLDPRDA